MFNRNKKKLQEKERYIAELTDESNKWHDKYIEVLRESTPENVLRVIMNRGINWYDYSELSVEKQKAYYDGAQSLLRSKVLSNEINHYIADMVEFAAKDSKDFAGVRDARMTINGLETLKERLESIIDPNNVDIPYVENVGDGVL